MQCQDVWGPFEMLNMSRDCMSQYFAYYDSTYVVHQYYPPAETYSLQSGSGKENRGIVTIVVESIVVFQRDLFYEIPVLGLLELWTD